jgi:hypothetical protein
MPGTDTFPLKAPTHKNSGGTGLLMAAKRLQSAYEQFPFHRHHAKTIPSPHLATNIFKLNVNTMNVNTKYFLPTLTALFALTAWVGTARAGSSITKTVNGTTYNITFVTGTFDSLSATLEASPIWGSTNEILAQTLAAEVGAAAPPSGDSYGDDAFFAWDEFWWPTTGLEFLAEAWPPNINYRLEKGGPVDVDFTFADVTVEAASATESMSWATTLFVVCPVLLARYHHHKWLRWLV